MMLRMTEDRVLLLTDVPRTETDSGLSIVKDWDPATTGLVVSVGPGRTCSCGRTVPMEVATGDRVIFPYTAGTEIEWEGETYMTMRQGDLLAVWKENGNG